MSTGELPGLSPSSESAPEAGTPQTVEGILDRVVFTSEDSGYTVARLRPDTGRLLTIVGVLTGVEIGERVRVEGHWAHHPKHGPQLKVDVCMPLVPHTEAGIRLYLGAGHVPGVGPQLAERIVAAFGLDTLKVIEHQPERLAEVEGIGPVRSGRICEAFKEKQVQREALIFLQGHHLPPGLSLRIWRRYAEQTIGAVRENPFRLAEEVRGIGFATADRVARALGFAADDPRRARAALIHLLRAAEEEGHCALPRAELVDQGDRLLGRLGAAEAALSTLLSARSVHEEADGLIFLPGLLDQELHAAERTRALTDGLMLPMPLDLLGFEGTTGVELAPAQQAAVKAAVESTVLLITGGPGTGKTTLVQALVHQFEMHGARVALAAPTGRAARRLSEATGRPASTLHRLLEFNARARGFKRDAEHPLAAEAIIVDEVSMVDLALYGALLSAVPTGARLILVGDADQLPSVGAGNVLHDLQTSGRVRQVQLTQVFRQARDSRIIINAHRLLRGELPESAPAGTDGDFFFVPAETPERARALILQLVTERIPQAFGLSPVDDVQVLTPMHRGQCGATALNEALQAALNPGAEGGGFHPGDKVMQIRNDYDKEVFNGDIGRVEARGEDGLKVRFEGDREVHYDLLETDALTLAYACTVHKSQGSEYPAVILPVLTEHWIMLQRNLLYTGITRGRRLVILVGQRRALSRAVDHVGGARARHTALARRLAVR